MIEFLEWLKVGDNAGTAVVVFLVVLYGFGYVIDKMRGDR